MKYTVLLMILALAFVGCKDNEADSADNITYPAIRAAFANKIDPDNMANYANQTIPAYITKDNTTGNAIRNEAATLGRVLFYDLNLSSNNTKSCASCHQQATAFSDTEVASIGVNERTGRHSMRLVNARFATEARFFWDERATTLELQTTMPIRDHGEMGFSGTNGDPTFEDLLAKLAKIGYYKELFTLAYGNEEVSEGRIRLALAQFIRSIQSFDSKYDLGLAQVANHNAMFPNFTQQEQMGKNLFTNPPQFNANGQRIGGGLGCGGCHRPPEFDIDPASRNNGLTASIAPGQVDLTNTRSPSLRDLFTPAPNSRLNGPMMHTGSFNSLEAVLQHYNDIRPNNNLDPRLRPNGVGQKLNLTNQEIDAVVAFLKTLSGSNIYTDPKWSNPFK